MTASSAPLPPPLKLRRTRKARHYAIAVVMTLTASVAHAHELGSARAAAAFDGDGRYTITIERVNTDLPQTLDSIDIYFDDSRVTTATAEYSREAATLRITGDIPPGARTFAFGYRATYGAIPLTVHDPRSREPRVLWVGRGERTPPIALEDVVPTRTVDVLRQYLALGFTHIVPGGLDHVLFVLGLFFLSAGVRSLLLQVTAFTVAHTITLGLTMLGVVSLRPSIVEPLIALSIAYVAIENLTTTELRRSRLALIFCFGLLHGMGFAGVLQELGFPRSQFFTALFAFNGGVELGQLTVLAAATVAVAGWRQRDASYLPMLARPASILIALTGVYWTIERVIS